MFKRNTLIFSFIFLGAFLMITGFAADYHLAPGDILDIQVYGYEELRVKELMIRPDGKLAFPLTGEIQAAGLTPSDLSAILTKALRAYVIDPQVTVNVVKFHTIRIYVLGEVVRPGIYEIDKQHNLLDAVSLAGGYTLYASKKSVFVIHKTTGQYVQIDLNNILMKGDLSQNYELADGDVVYLAKNGMSFVREILPVLTSIYNIHEILE